jgi:hypothetical protein
MSERPFEYKTVRIVDIDGTIIKKKAPESNFADGTEAYEGSVDVLREWFDRGNYIILWTARPESYRQVTEKELFKLGYQYHKILMGKPYTHDMHIYDDKDIKFHKVDCEVGLKK